MKRTPLTRKTALCPRRPGKATITAAARRHYGILAALPCVICGRRPVTIHHIKEREDGTFLGAGMRSSYIECIPLCPTHHQDGGHGVAYHAGPRAWVARYGSQRALLNALLAFLDDPECPYPRAEEVKP